MYVLYIADRHRNLTIKLHIVLLHMEIFVAWSWMVREFGYTNLYKNLFHN